MSNPFHFFKCPANAKEAQSNANWATYERMGACELLAEYDAAKVQAPHDVIANAHTMRWVEKEYIRQAQKARS